MNISQLFPKPHPQTAGRVIDGEAVLIMSDASIINVLNGVASRIFELADGSRSLADIAVAIATEYDVPPAVAEQDTKAFVDGLVAEQVLTY